ncbi:hypothetical protein AN219_14555 [Streptomyces nanshensis]|nr:hypothetical protein AN219_14555 [Streptomyces nanshensis]
MGPELSDLERQSLSPAHELAAREAGQFSIVLFCLAVLAPLLLVYLSFTTGLRLWLTLPNLVCTYAGLCVVVTGRRRGRRRLVSLGTAGTAMSFAVCLVTLALLS